MADRQIKVDTADKTPEELKQELKLRKKEWEQIESLVMVYQRQFHTEPTDGEALHVVDDAKYASGELIRKFYPLFKKYILLIKSAQIDFDDYEMKQFVLSFIGDQQLKRALRRHKQKAEYRHQILKKFNFIKETYGSLPAEEIMVDLQMLFLEMAKRYKQIGRSFCAYLYNSFRHDISRHIKRFTRNPSNIHYRNCEYEDHLRYACDDAVDSGCFEDKFYEDSMGIPDLSWISGVNCSAAFRCLTPFERKLLIKYYIEEYNDRQIAQEYAIHINTCNQKRRQAVIKLAKAMGIDEKDIKRNRKSGKKNILF